VEHRVRWIGCEQVFRGSICEFCLYHHGQSNAWETWYGYVEASVPPLRLQYLPISPIEFASFASGNKGTSLGKNHKGYMPKDLRCKSCDVDIIPICGTWLHRNRPFATSAIPIRRATSILGESRSREESLCRTHQVQVRIQGCRSHLLLVSPTIRWPVPLQETDTKPHTRTDECPFH